jgi:hypothetical protein
LQWHIRAQVLLHGLGAVATSGFVGRCGDRWSLWTVPAVASSLSDALAANHTHCKSRCSEINGPPGAVGPMGGPATSTSDAGAATVKLQTLARPTSRLSLCSDA